MKKAAIIGAGPAGIYCALHLKNFLPDINIDIFDKNPPLKTLLPTGGGRCNLTHFADDIKEFAKNYPRGEKFLYSIFAKHFVADTLDFFEKIGIKTYMQQDNRYFPVSNSSFDMRKKMLAALSANIIQKKVTSAKELESYDYVILATGSADGCKLAKETGHNIVEQKPALCGLKLSSKSPCYPQGVVLKTPDGDVLFTKDGISGPLIYKLSSINAYKKFPYTITLPLIDTQKLREKMQQMPKKSFGNVVCEFIPKSFARILTKNFDTKCAEVKKADIEALANISFDVISTDGKGEIVHAGGVDLAEVTNFCRSKINPKIFFCGEILNIDGFCGGFNLQNCWSSAFCAAAGISSD